MIALFLILSGLASAQDVEAPTSLWELEWTVEVANTCDNLVAPKRAGFVQATKTRSLQEMIEIIIKVREQVRSNREMLQLVVDNSSSLDQDLPRLVHACREAEAAMTDEVERLVPIAVEANEALADLRTGHVRTRKITRKKCYAQAVVVIPEIRHADTLITSSIEKLNIVTMDVLNLEPTPAPIGIYSDSINE